MKTENKFSNHNKSKSKFSSSFIPIENIDNCVLIIHDEENKYKNNLRNRYSLNSICNFK